MVMSPNDDVELTLVVWMRIFVSRVWAGNVCLLYSRSHLILGQPLNQSLDLYFPSFLGGF